MPPSSFADLASTPKKKTTRKERGLAELAQLLPWPAFLQPLLKRAPNPGQGRRPIPGAVLWRISFLQQGYG